MKQTIEILSSVRSFVIDGEDTVLCLDTELWSALEEIAEREHSTLQGVCDAVHFTKAEAMILPRALYLFALDYYKSAVLASDSDVLNKDIQAQCLKAALH